MHSPTLYAASSVSSFLTHSSTLKAVDSSNHILKTFPAHLEHSHGKTLSYCKVFYHASKLLLLPLQIGRTLFYSSSIRPIQMTHSLYLATFDHEFIISSTWSVAFWTEVKPEFCRLLSIFVLQSGDIVSVTS